MNDRDQDSVARAVVTIIIPLALMLRRVRLGAPTSTPAR
jgi:hypothetical protein